MDTIFSLKNSCEDFEVEYDIISSPDKNRAEIADGLKNVDDLMALNQSKIDEMNSEIDRLTNHADGLDYMVAVASGVLTGLLDAFVVGEFSFEEGKKWGEEQVNEFVVKVAKSQGYTGDDLYGAVKYMEGKFPIVADKVTNDFGGGLQHHLRDFSHHPTPVGLFFSFLTQFTKKAYGADVAGVFKIVDIKETDWILIGESIPEKFTFGVINWFFHMVSDVAGSSSSILEGKSGTGLPGPIVSLLKEVSALPIFRNMNKSGYKEFSVWISKLFNGTLLAEKDSAGRIVNSVKFDLRAELGVLHELGQQAMPVILNECIVRGFYFIRRFVKELKDNQIKNVRDFKKINWKNTLPFKNRTVIRMLTIATGTFTTIDLADAAINSAVKSGGQAPLFLKNMILRVNFVGIGRFAIAVGTDVNMGIKRGNLRNERIDLYNKQLVLLNAKVYYKEADMWVSAENTGEAVLEAYKAMQTATEFYLETIKENRKALDSIDNNIKVIRETNPEYIQELSDIVERKNSAEEMTMKKVTDTFGNPEGSLDSTLQQLNDDFGEPKTSLDETLELLN